MKSSTWKTLNTLTGGLSAPSKMPSHGWSIRATTCAMGAILRKVAGSTCSGCYALKGRYMFANVQDALARRLEAWKSSPVEWIGAMIGSILKTRNNVFRWFDSGDIQGPEMLSDIATIATGTEGVRHWLPTRERARVKAWLRDGHRIPDNLNIRVSAPMVDGRLPQPIEGCTMSTVISSEDKLPEGAVMCRAYTQGNECKDCRACWDKSVPIVTYLVH